MKKLISSFTAAAMLLSAPAAFAVTIGDVAPAFTAMDAAGKTVHLSDYKGKIVVLEWTSTECPFVKKHYDSGNMQKLQKAAADNGVVWLSVDSSGKDKPGYMDGAAATEWIKNRNAAPSDVLIDAEGNLGHLYGAKTTPHMFVIDKDGKLAYAGAIDSKPSTDPADVTGATNYVSAALSELEAGKSVTVSATQSYGCSVKYSE